MGPNVMSQIAAIFLVLSVGLALAVPASGASASNPTAVGITSDQATASP
jgi:hypothetical protein